MDGYVTKPIDAASLLKTMGEFLARSSAPPSVEEAPAGTSSAPQPLPLDVKALLARCTGKAAFAQKMLDKFSVQAATGVQSLMDALASKQIPEAERSAHTIKGMAATVGAEPLKRVAAEIELALRTAEMTDMEGKLAQLKSELQRCTDALPELRVQLQQAAASGTTGK